MTTRTDDIPETLDAAATEQADGSEHLKTVALRAYSGHRHRPIGDEEILQMLPMVHKIARRAVTYLRPPLSFDDLVSAGTVGLLKAARDFDASHLAEFTTYAYIRVKGAILDELRRASLLPSGVNRRIRDAMRLSRQIAQETGTPPSDEELAERLGILIEELYVLFEGARAQHFASIDAGGPDEPVLGDLLAAADSSAPDNRIEKAEMLQKLAEAMQELDERRLQIIVLYYHKHLTMKQIADVLGVTESRVSQLHASALVSLAAKLEEYNDGR